MKINIGNHEMTSSIQSKSDSSGSSKDQTSASSKDQTSTKPKINKIIPDIQKEIKQRTDKKLEVKNRNEQKRQEIQQRLDMIKKDLQQEKNTKSSKK